MVGMHEVVHSLVRFDPKCWSNVTRFRIDPRDVLLLPPFYTQCRREASGGACVCERQVFPVQLARSLSKVCNGVEERGIGDLHDATERAV